MIKVNNLTEIHHHHHQNDDVFEPTAIMEHLPSDYNSFGASMFIVIVLLWYSISLVCMLGIQIRGRAETIEDFARRRAQFLIQNIEDQTEKREILGETKNGGRPDFSVTFEQCSNRFLLSSRRIDRSRKTSSTLENLFRST